jgi:hypothetical protein
MYGTKQGESPEKREAFPVRGGEGTWLAGFEAGLLEVSQPVLARIAPDQDRKTIKRRRLKFHGIYFAFPSGAE